MTNQFVVPPHIGAFLRDAVRSIWGLEVLLLLHTTSPKAWSISELTMEIRGSEPLVEDVLKTLSRARVVKKIAADRHAIALEDPKLAALISELAILHAEYPVAIVKEILRSPNQQIQVFVDAFKIGLDSSSAFRPRYLEVGGGASSAGEETR